MTTILLHISLALTALGAAACSMPFIRGRLIGRTGAAAAVAAGMSAFAAGVAVLFSGEPSSLFIEWPLPYAAFSLQLDGLSAFFILPVSLVCALAGIYGLGYTVQDAGRPRYRIGWICFLLLMASMILVITAANTILFLMAWEGMTLSSFFLVMHSHERGEVRRAGWIYLTASHIGTACLLVLFALPGGHASLLFLLAMVGFGTKAGLVPLHVWLPEAHPAAPSHVSAVMSGVMIKTGIYGILRTVTLLGSPDTWPLWWGPALIAAGSVSAVYGVLNASGQRDIKRLLAYSSVENIGIVFTGLGLWMLGASTGNGLMSSLGLAGAMLHIWNHSIFKALLFLGAGALAKATGTRDIEELGGLLRSMRKTGLAFFTGSAAITGLPPLNGFPGEFLIYWAAFTGVIGGGSFLPTVSAVFAIGSLALTGGLAMVCFTRLFGTAFLGSPRSEEAAGAGEVSPVIYAPMLILAGLCVAGGVLAPLILRILPGVGNVSLLSSVLWKVTLASLMLPAAALAAGASRKLLLKARPVEAGATWGCGYDQPSCRMQYSASSFSRPVLLVFRNMLFLHGSTNGNTGLFPGKITLRTGVREAFTRCLYQPLFRGFLRASDRFSRLQHGRNQLYILYVALTLIALLLWKLGVSP